MSLRFFAIGALAGLAAVTASSAVAPARLINLHRPAVPGGARLYAVGTRSAAQRQSGTTAKMDSVLADLSRHASMARPQHLLADLHSLSPAARFAQLSAGGPVYVAIDATTRGDPRALESFLVSLGLQKAAVYSNDVGGFLPINQLETAAARAEVAGIRASMSRARATGPVATQGDFAQLSSVVRTNYPTLLGTGVTVGVLSDSFDCYAVYAVPGSGVPVSGNEGYAYNGFTADYATDVSTGALPAGVNVLAEPYTSVPSSAGDCLNYGAPTQTPFSDEGRAMLQIVHAVAPGASLAFYTAEDSEADFATGIGALAAAGAKVIADDVGYFDEPFFQDGIVAQAIDAVEAQWRRLFFRGRQRQRSDLPEHGAELSLDLDQRIERGRASAQFRPDGRHEYHLSVGSSSGDSAGRFHRRGGGVGSALRDRRSRKPRREQRHRSLRHRVQPAPSRSRITTAMP